MQDWPVIKTARSTPDLQAEAQLSRWFNGIVHSAVQCVLLGHVRRKTGRSSPEWQAEAELSQRVAAAHAAAEQGLNKASRALSLLQQALQALTGLAADLPKTSQVHLQDCVKYHLLCAHAHTLGIGNSQAALALVSIPELLG